MFIHRKSTDSQQTCFPQGLSIGTLPYVWAMRWVGVSKIKSDVRDWIYINNLQYRIYCTQEIYTDFFLTLLFVLLLRQVQISHLLSVMYFPWYKNMKIRIFGNDFSVGRACHWPNLRMYTTNVHDFPLYRSFETTKTGLVKDFKSQESDSSQPRTHFVTLWIHEYCRCIL